MCLLTFFPEGVMPDTIALENGALWNSDGHGYAIVDEPRNRIITHHGMDPSKVIDRFEEARFRFPDGAALFHSRMATHGVGGKFNVHPFPVGGDARTVIGHNGIFPAQPKVGDIRSDTRVVADMLGRDPFGHLRTRKARKRFSSWMGSGNKVALLTVDPSYPRTWYILNERYGVWVDDIWYSNDGFRSYPASKKSTFNAWWDDYDEEIEAVLEGEKEAPWKSSFRSDCTVCLSRMTVNNVSLICEFCNCCNDCQEYIEACQCYYNGEHEGIYTIGPRDVTTPAHKPSQLMIEAKPAITAVLKGAENADA